MTRMPSAAIISKQIPVLAGREWLAHDDLLGLDTLGMTNKGRLVGTVAAMEISGIICSLRAPG